MKSILRLRKETKDKRLSSLEQKVLEMRIDLRYYAQELRELESLVRKKLKDTPDLTNYDLKIKEIRRKFLEAVSSEPA